MKRLWIAGVAAVAVGTVMFGAGFAVSGFNIRALDTEQPLEEKTMVLETLPSAVEITEAMGDIRLGISQDNRIHLTYFENTEEFYEIENNVKFSMEKKNEKPWYRRMFNFSFGSSDCALTILLPEQFVGDVRVTTGSGGISGENMNMGNFWAKSGNGDVRLHRVTAERGIEMMTGSGDISLENIVSTGDIRCNSWNGSVQYKNIHGENIYGETANGDMRYGEVYAKNTFLVKSDNGSIQLQEVSAEELMEMTTGSGDISGSILGEIGDYTIDAKTVNGDNTLPEKMPGGSKILRVKSGNGEINITFTE
ncbi:MAG: DUF4097 family beta strand repeat-containing protein [Oscillospiraceae bacterium]